ncbi:type II toxin-antitoxin system RelE/ParE family toxin [Sphingoaurantiacus capsulatus]|uniref:Type II toxin-antitoxin system RelE/ParE family toxin n=1 Tax=Sphingoaurantiacus capsulatus TaxID=1771310 RepID=A0ABV7XAE7_9SPHN
MTGERRIEYSRAAVKALRSIDVPASRLIRAKVKQYAVDPASLANNVKRLQGVDALRLRVGDYRVIFTETLIVLTVLKVGHRRQIYD